ncbi:MAG TPA: HAMP domain-containing sensor histidine kinase [Gemmatimonadales bacterium]|nr:HAMP domain-containing sensor histidine kinase [Gemmatimonadales bacterium]
MAALSFRSRILLILLCVGILPTAAAVVGWALMVRSAGWTSPGQEALVEVGASGRHLLQTLDTTRLSAVERRALNEHAARLNTALIRSERAAIYSRYYATGLALLILLVGAIGLIAVVRLGGHLSRQLSRPIDELIGWTGHLRRGEPLPPDRPRRGAPEFAALRQALREMADALEEGRRRELEAERLRTFRELARRVAHEMKNPLTPMRLALRQLKRTATPDQSEAVTVLSAESERLEELARAFTDLGKLPEGPPAEVDLGELASELVRTMVPPTVNTELALDPATPHVMGHYEPLRRAVANLLRNSVEAIGGEGQIRVHLAPNDGGLELIVHDNGPGIPAPLLERLFEPYVTGKPDGTGLGLALVRSTVEAHGGRVQATNSANGGAEMRIWLPGMAE